MWRRGRFPQRLPPCLSFCPVSPKFSRTASVHPEHPLSSKVSRLPSAEVLMGGGGEILQEAGPTNALHV